MEISVENLSDSSVSVIESNEPGILSEIYKSEVNIVIWRRTLSPAMKLEIQNLLFHENFMGSRATVDIGESADYLEEIICGQSNNLLLRDDISQLIEMYAYLFDLQTTGVRIRSLSEAMCPRFHVDRVPCRLVSTYHGPATEWLYNDCVDRSKLGHGNQGLPDEKSGLISDNNCIQSLTPGDVALLKGELWPNNEGSGLVHRSPNASNGNKRLLLSLDFMT